MLNPPLSLLSDDLLNYIVDHVVNVPFSDDDLYNLSITDRAFTQFCQAYIFKDIYLGNGSRKIISKKLSKITNILNDEPSFANRVRTVHLVVAHKRTQKESKWLFNNPNFVTIIGLLAKSLMPPHKLHLTGLENSFIIEEPVLVVGWLMQSFFSQSLTVLDITDCRNVPLTVFLVCPNLREVYLFNVKVLESRDDELEYPDLQCSGRELPALECLNYRNSGSLVKQMIALPPKFSMSVVDWSKLRVLVLHPQDKEEMVCLQPILDAACNTLEELYLTSLPAWDVVTEQLSFAGFVDLRRLSKLHILEIHSLIRCEACDECEEPMVLLDIEPVLSTIPEANQVTKLLVDLEVYCEHPFNECLEEDWVGMCDEIVRVSAGKPLQLDFQMMISPALGQDEWNKRIDEMLAPLSDYPNIRTKIWHPSDMI